jgi:hypothetical protein
MRILTECFVVAALSAAVGLSSQELRSRYGEPDMERFIARPGIGLTVEYGSDRLVCEASIEAPQALIHRPEEPVPFMSPDAVTEILDEVAPSDVRGKEIGKSIIMRGCNEFQILEYENVSITRSTHNCLPLKPKRELRATIAFKREACPSVGHIFTLDSHPPKVQTRTY